MSGLARIMLEDGCAVSGSDLKLSPLVAELARQGATVFEGHAAQNLGQAELVVISSAVPADNPEVRAAKDRGLPVLKRAEFLAHMMEGRYGIAVAGSHGKSTTTALIAFLLEEGGLDPTIVVGGEMVNLGTNAKRGQGEHFVAEADEFDGSFLHMAPALAVVTNIEPEHLDYYGSFPAVLDAFAAFLQKVAPEGNIVACTDDPGVNTLIPQISRHVVTYGLMNSQALWRARDIRGRDGGGHSFAVWRGDASFGEFSTRLPGRHNVANSLAAIAASSLVGLNIDLVRDALPRFQGVRRRFELRGEVDGITIIDDYAHHPTEIRVTLEAARERYPGRCIRCIFQPHTYSRTKLLLNEFSTCFDPADAVIVADIYPAREQDVWGIDSTKLVAALRHPHAYYGGSLEQAIELQLQQLAPGDVLMVMGAGDVTKASEAIIKRLSHARV